MRIALYGPTGAGKSTLAEALRRIYGLHTVSTGDFVRHEFPNDPLAGGFSDREKQILEFVEREINLDETVLDGFPRHLEQLKWLFELSVSDAVTHVFLPITEPIARERVKLRGRADVAKFAEQYFAQVAAMHAMHEFMHGMRGARMITHCHSYGPWGPDQLAKWLVKQITAPSLMGKEE